MLYKYRFCCLSVINHKYIFFKVIKLKINSNDKINYDCTFYIFHASILVLVLVNTFNTEQYLVLEVSVKSGIGAALY